MAVRKTIERILRDDGDDAGQSIREWVIEAESGFIKIKLKFGDGFILLRADDIGLFVNDLYSAVEMSSKD